MLQGRRYQWMPLAEHRTNTATANHNLANISSFAPESHKPQSMGWWSFITLSIYINVYMTLAKLFSLPACSSSSRRASEHCSQT